MSVSIYDVAEEAGVSIATVSRFVNGYEGIKQDKKKAIELAMQKLHFVPNQVARSLATSSTEMIGLVGPMISLQYSYMSEYIKGALKYTESTRYSLVLISSEVSTTSSSDKPLRFMEYVQKNRVDGLLLITKDRPNFYEEHYQYLLSKHIPLTYIGRPIDRTIPCPSVFSAYAQFDKYTYDVICEFVRLGHTRISVMLVQNDSHENRFIKVLEALKRDIDSEFEVFVSLLTTEDDSDAACEDILRNACTATFVASLAILPRVVQYLDAHDLYIPKDISLISVEYKEGEGQAFNFTVDCVYVPSFELGYHSARFLCKYLNHDKDLDLDIKIDYTIIKRGSTRRLD